MLQIAICDDNRIQNDMTKELLEAYGEEKQHALSVSDYENGIDLLRDVRQGKHFDVYVLDMIMPQQNGIDVAKALRKAGIEDKIVFLTSTAELAIEAYDVQAYHYLLKPLDAVKMWQLLDKIVLEIKGEEKENLEIKVREGQKRIWLEELLYVDITNRAPCYHIKDGTCLEGLSLRHPFKEAVKDLIASGNFAMAGASMAVNLSQIDFMSRNTVIMAGGDTIYPPKSALGQLYEDWQAYWAKKGVSIATKKPE